MVPRVLTILLLSALLATNVYRAWSQAITIDEAFTYNLYVDGPAINIITIFDANHHFLHTVLCRISRWLFGQSEFTVRIPSLLGGLLYLITTLRLCRYVFGEGWFTFFSFALLSMSPAVLDYMSAARGYGLGLAFFFWALLQMMIYRVERTDAAIGKAAIGLALAVGFNLVFAFPGAALGIVFMILLASEGRWRPAVDRFLVPGIVLSFAILYLPLAHAERGNFYFGAKSLSDSVDSVIDVAWVHHGGQRLSFTDALPALQRWAPVVVPAILLWAAAMCFRARRRTEGALLALTTGALIGSVALLMGVHKLFGVMYPYRRTGLYWIPLLLWVWLLLVHLSLRGRYRLAAAPLLAAGLLCLAQFVSQLCVRHYSEWQGDASNRRLVQEIRRLHAETPAARARIGAATAMLEPGLNFYRLMFRLDWMDQVYRTPIDDGCDYYVALPGEAGLLDPFSVTKIYEDPVTHAILAVPKR